MTRYRKGAELKNSNSFFNLHLSFVFSYWRRRAWKFIGHYGSQWCGQNNLTERFIQSKCRPYANWRENSSQWQKPEIENQEHFSVLSTRGSIYRNADCERTSHLSGKVLQKTNCSLEMYYFVVIFL